MYSTIILFQIHCRHTRSIDLIAAHSLINSERLSQETIPTGYHLYLTPFPDLGYFVADVKINISIQHETNQIVLNAHGDLTILELNATLVTPPDEVQNR